ncbi:MAG: DUF885 domain-containing protein [Phycisphaerales bacterium]|nr:DUF885 domain-containing protein [Phycisphaerales bacterium]
MKYIFLVSIVIFLGSCKLERPTFSEAQNINIDTVFSNYYHERMALFPLEASMNGDNQYDDQLPATFTDSYRLKIDSFYNKYLVYLQHLDRNTLNYTNQISYDVLMYEMTMGVEGLQYHGNYIPFTQFDGVQLLFPQLGSGHSLQPFQTISDYERWEQRVAQFPAYIDSSIVYFQKGMDAQWTLNNLLVEKMISQIEDLLVYPVEKSIFYEPIKSFPTNFSKDDRARLAMQYRTMIETVIYPTYRKLDTFLSEEYLPNASSATGLSGCPGGLEYYKYLVKEWTTTNQSYADIQKVGFKEVAKIEKEIEQVKKTVGYEGSNKDFFDFVTKSKKFYPFTSNKEILDSFRNIDGVIQANMPKLFSIKPKTALEIRQTEAFRAASASPEYAPGSYDGKRSAVFYVPILNPHEFYSIAMQNLFLHEAIPGHHFQISLKQEDTLRPLFMRVASYGAIEEGWALYAESLGKDLGCFTNPYQYLGHLSDDMLRAVRLVVDVALHTGTMTHDQAVAYMLEYAPMDKGTAMSEIERYMAYPAQALSYKVGSLFIVSLKEKYMKELGDKFNIIQFHDAILRSGSVPLSILAKEMDHWATTQQAY